MNDLKLTIWEIAESLGYGRQITYTPDEVAAILRMGRRQVYEHVRSGRIRSVRNGNRWLVPVNALAEFIGAQREGYEAPR